MNPAHKLVEKFGSNAEVGRLFKISREAVRLWVEKGIPPDRALEVEKMTDGEVDARTILEYAAKQSKARAAA